MWSFTKLVFIFPCLLSLVFGKHTGKKGLNERFLNERGRHFRVGEDRSFEVPSVLNEHTVKPFSNIYAGQTGIVFGTGRSLNKYRHVDVDELGKHIVTFGSNGIVYSGIPIDHLFVADPTVKDGPNATVMPSGVGYKANRRAINAYTPRVKKWFATWPNKRDHAPPPDQVKRAGGTYFEADGPAMGAHLPVKDIGHCMFGAVTSTPLFALQLALYTGLDRIFIVGVDLNELGGSARRVPQSWMEYLKPAREIRRDRGREADFRTQQEGWWMASQAYHRWYPNTKIYVVNPGKNMVNITQPEWTDLNVTRGEPIPFHHLTTHSGYAYQVRRWIYWLVTMFLVFLGLPSLLKRLAAVPVPPWARTLFDHHLPAAKASLLNFPGVQRAMHSPEGLLVIRSVTPIVRDIWYGLEAIGEWLGGKWTSASSSILVSVCAVWAVVHLLLSEAGLVIRLIWSPLQAQYVNPLLRYIISQPLVIQVWHHSFTQFLIQIVVSIVEVTMQLLRRAAGMMYDFILSLPVLFIQCIWVILFTPLIVVATFLDIVSKSTTGERSTKHHATEEENDQFSSHVNSGVSSSEHMQSDERTSEEQGQEC